MNPEDKVKLEFWNPKNNEFGMLKVEGLEDSEIALVDEMIGDEIVKRWNAFDVMMDLLREFGDKFHTFDIDKGHKQVEKIFSLFGDKLPEDALDELRGIQSRLGEAYNNKDSKEYGQCFKEREALCKKHKLSETEALVQYSDSLGCSCCQHKE